MKSYMTQTDQRDLAAVGSALKQAPPLLAVSGRTPTGGSAFSLSHLDVYEIYCIWTSSVLFHAQHLNAFIFYKGSQLKSLDILVKNVNVFTAALVFNIILSFMTCFNVQTSQHLLLFWTDDYLNNYRLAVTQLMR